MNRLTEAFNYQTLFALVIFLSTLRCDARWNSASLMVF